jgi:hypothetical protein
MRFLLFTFDMLYPRGGWSDFVEASDTEGGIRAALKALRDIGAKHDAWIDDVGDKAQELTVEERIRFERDVRECYQIVDLQSGGVVIERGDLL